MMKKTLILLFALALSFAAQPARSQGIIVNKTDGTSVRFNASEVESITILKDASSATAEIIPTNTPAGRPSRPAFMLLMRLMV